MPKGRSLQQWLDWQLSLHPTEIDLGLERVGAVFDRLGQPRPAPRVLTIAGTNGKGSCVAMLTSILQQHGLSVGSYTSPHLLRYNERVQVDNVPVADADLVAAFERVDQARQESALTFFEFGTLAALVLLAEAQLDVALLEVGLGGRLDAVNLIDADAALITGIDYDHQDWLGDTLEAIAREKAGVMRAGRPVIFGAADRPKTIDEAAQAVGAELIACNRDYRYTISGATWDFEGAGNSFSALPFPRLPGRHQVQNAAACLALLECPPIFLRPDELAIGRGLTQVRLPGRLQKLAKNPEVLVDVAHNLQSCDALRAYLHDNPVPGQTLAVFGALRDKQPAALVEHIQPLVDHWFVASPANPRSMTRRELAAAVGSVVSADRWMSFGSVAEAYAAAIDFAEAIDRIVVFGSFFTVEEVLTSTS